MLFALALIGVGVRLIFRIAIQRQFAVDDAVLILGACTLIAAFVIMYVEVVDRMYMAVALQLGTPGVMPPGNPPGDMKAVTQLIYDFHTWVTVTLMLSWCSIMAAKFSFLAFFWKLIDRIHGMKIYWWVVFTLQVGILGYGISVYYLACPYFDDPRACKYSSSRFKGWILIDSVECSTGKGKRLLLTHSFTQMSLDIFGDLLSM